LLKSGFSIPHFRILHFFPIAAPLEAICGKG
jgi:hypothetical protein